MDSRYKWLTPNSGLLCDCLLRSAKFPFQLYFPHMNRMENVIIRQWVACRRTLGDVWLRSHQSCYQPAKMHHCENMLDVAETPASGHQDKQLINLSTVSRVWKGEDFRKEHWLQPPWKWGTGMHMIMAMHCKVLQLSLLMHRVLSYDQGRWETSFDFFTVLPIPNSY